jgi:hypothetical protein
MGFKFNKAKSWGNLGEKTGQNLGNTTKSIGKGAMEVFKTPFDTLSDMFDSPSLMLILVGGVALVLVVGVGNNGGSSRNSSTK